MKKCILIAGVMFFTMLQAKAQQEKQFIATGNPATIKITTLPGDNLFGKNIYTSGYGGPTKDYDYYNRTSRTLRITGLSLLGAGLILGGAGIIVASSKHTNDYNAEVRAERTNRTLFVSSAAAGIASIPLMVMASVYKHKAKLMISNQKTGFGVPSNMSRDITGISLVFAL